MTHEQAEQNVELKLIVCRLGSKCDTEWFGKFLKEKGVEFARCKKPFSANCGTIWFKDVTQKESAKPKLQGALSKFGEAIEIRECWEVNRKRLERITTTTSKSTEGLGEREGDEGEEEEEEEGDAKEGECEGEPAKKKQKEEKEKEGSSEGEEEKEKEKEKKKAETKPKTVNDVVAPKWKQGYTSQLEEKALVVRKTAAAIVSKLMKSRKKVQQQKGREEEGTQVAPVVRHIESVDGGKVNASPKLEGYRNKVAFTIGRDRTGTEMRVGFSEGSFEHGQMSVCDMNSEGRCILISERCEAIRAAFERHVRASAKEPWSKT